MDHLQLLHRNTQSPDPRDAYALFNEIQTAGQTDELEDAEEISEECEQESTAPAPSSSVVTEDLTRERRSVVDALITWKREV